MYRVYFSARERVRLWERHNEYNIYVYIIFHCIRHFSTHAQYGYELFQFHVYMYIHIVPTRSSARVICSNECRWRARLLQHSNILNSCLVLIVPFSRPVFFLIGSKNFFCIIILFISFYFYPSLLIFFLPYLRVFFVGSTLGKNEGNFLLEFLVGKNLFLGPW